MGVVEGKPKQVLFETDHLRLWYHPDGNIVHHEIRRGIVGADFRTMLTKGAECIENRLGCKWLSDDRAHVALKREEYEWGDSVWSPRMLAAGFKYWAIVLPESQIGQMQMKRFADRYRELGVTVKTFASVDEGLAWLRAVDAPGQVAA